MDSGSYDPARYGEAVGDYDQLYPGVEADTLAAVELIAELSASRPERSVVEFGIGTGRLAVPLATHGVAVSGLDGSESMISKLRQKPGGQAIPVVIGDYRDDLVARKAFGVVVLALNGIFDPRGVSAQLDIFRNAAAHLGDGGFFILETWVLHDANRRGDWTVAPRYVGHEHVEFQLARYDLATNTIQRTLLHVRGDGTEFVTVTDTYASPGELDVMAAATGFERAARYADWAKAPFTVASSAAVSVFRLASAQR